MDFDLHFGRFFGPKIDVFEKFLLPDFELQLEIRSAKIVILPRENAVFYKIDILALKWQPMKNIKKQEKHHFEIKLFFHIDFSWILEPTWMDFGLQVEAIPRQPPRPFFQVAAKRRPRGAQEAPRASQGRLKSLQQPPKRAPRVPKSDQNVPRARPRCLQRVTFLRISLFFNVFLRFFAFACVFLCFFCVFLQRTPVNFSTLSSKLNCVRQQAKASKSKQKQAKGSQSKQEPARV